MVRQASNRLVVRGAVFVGEAGRSQPRPPRGIVGAMRNGVVTPGKGSAELTLSPFRAVGIVAEPEATRPSRRGR